MPAERAQRPKSSDQDGTPPRSKSKRARREKTQIVGMDDGAIRSFTKEVMARDKARDRWSHTKILDNYERYARLLGEKFKTPGAPSGTLARLYDLEDLNAEAKGVFGPNVNLIGETILLALETAEDSRLGSWASNKTLETYEAYARTLASGAATHKDDVMTSQLWRINRLKKLNSEAIALFGTPAEVIGKPLLSALKKADGVAMQHVVGAPAIEASPGTTTNVVSMPQKKETPLQQAQAEMTRNPKRLGKKAVGAWVPVADAEGIAAIAEDSQYGVTDYVGELISAHVQKNPSWSKKAKSS